jgi:hypothetical protein
VKAGARRQRAGWPRIPTRRERWARIVLSAITIAATVIVRL